MTRPRPRIGSELLPVLLILCCLAGTWALVVSMHRRSALARKSVAKKPAQPVASVAPRPMPVVVAPPPPPPEPPPAPDPTRTALAKIGAEEAGQILEARAADRKAEALERARMAAVLESERWKRRERLIRDQLDAAAERVREAEIEADALAMERDVLAHERDAARAAIEKSRNRSSFAVLPNRAPNGTWRRPIVIECKNGAAALQPRGPSFTLLELSSLMGARSSPIVLAVVRELIRVQGATAPDGSPAVPYIFFVVRPDGIRPYYEARARLESLGIAFGYELVDQNMEIDFPDLDHPDEWDGSAPVSRFPVASNDDRRPPGTPAHGRGSSGIHTADDFVWHSNRPEALGGPGPYDEGSDHSGRGGGMPGGPRGDLAGNAPGGGEPGGGPSRGLPPAGGAGGNLGRPGRSTPGMLPPSFGPVGPPIRGGGSFAGSSGGGGGVGGGGMPRGSGRDGSHEPVAGGEAVPGQLPEGFVPGTRPRQEVASLDGLPPLGRGAGEGSRFRSRGLKPGEPGAPPEELPGLGSAGQGSGGGPSSGGGSSGGSGSAAAGGSSSASGSAMASDPSGSDGGDSSGGEPGMQGAQGEPGSRRSGPLRIEVPMEIVVACGPAGVTIHPGGYQLSRRSLKDKGEVLARSLKTIVRQRQQVDPMIRPRPSIRFLVEPGGADVYRDARRQTFVSGIDWPTVLQVSDTRVLDFLPRERF